MSAASVRIAAADLRESWPAWLSVSVVFLVTGASIALSGLVLVSGTAGELAGVLAHDDAETLQYAAGINIGMTTLVALSVVSSATGLVVESRRGAIARLLLAGAAPRQVARVLRMQLLVVALAFAVAGAVIAIAVQQSVIDLVSADQGFAGPRATVSAGPLVGTVLYCVLLAALGGRGALRRATRTAPVQALRAAAAPAVRLPAWSIVVRVLVAGTCFVVLAVSVVGFRLMAVHLGPDSGAVLMQMAFIAIPLSGLGLSLVAPVLVGPLTRLWTKAVPTRSASWWLARSILLTRTDRLARSVVPVMLTVGLTMAMATMIASVNATFRTLGRQALSNGSFTSILVVLALPLLVSIAGAVASLAMTGRQRSAELALEALAGATPRQRVTVAVLEAAQVVGTGLVLGLVIAATSVVVLGFGATIESPVFVVEVPWLPLLATVAFCLVACGAATVVPVLRSLHEPAPRAVARLAAS